MYNPMLRYITIYIHKTLEIYNEIVQINIDHAYYFLHLFCFQ